MSNLSDVVGAANLFGGVNYSFVPDRFCSPNSSEIDSVFLTMVGTKPQIKGNIYNGLIVSSISTSPILVLNQWYFISFVFSGTTGYIYRNGSQVATGTMFVPKNIIRATNYIGKSNLANQINADAIYDEFKIYQRALSFDEIMNEYQISLKNGKLCFFYNYMIMLFIKFNLKGNVINNCSKLTTTTTTTLSSKTTSNYSANSTITTGNFRLRLNFI